LRRCIREQLVGGEGFAVDASLIKEDANRQKGIEGDKGLPPEVTGRAIDEYLAVLDDAAFGAREHWSGQRLQMRRYLAQSGPEVDRGVIPQRMMPHAEIAIARRCYTVGRGRPRSPA
jgi:hypothetical protein